MHKNGSDDAYAYAYDDNGKVLIGLVKGNDTLRFSYDAAGNVAAVNHNGTYYYYLRNGQGDIVKIIDSSGNTVVEYMYDSWGKQLSCTGTLATTLGALNPFRYRGYVYDEETQWYYLKSRYYDPETCRFISADVLLSTGQGVIGHNCYAYCLNKPVELMDWGGSVPSYNVMIADSGGSGGTSIIYGEGEAISIKVTSSQIVICAYVDISGPIDQKLIISGIEEYWSGTFEISGTHKTLKTSVIQGVSRNGKTIRIATKDKLGVSHVNWSWFGLYWSPQSNGKMTLFNGDKRSKYYYNESELKWVAAHEFGHLLGVEDYYKKHPNSPKDSIFNKFLGHLTSEDLEMVLNSFATQSIGRWD